MAVDDETFYNLLGEEISRTGLVQEMINYYQLKKEVGETEVTDFNEGSEVRNLLEAIAVDLYVLMEEENELTKEGFIDTADGEFLDKHGENPFIQLPRDLGTEATGSVTFTVTEAPSAEVVIPAGTIVVASGTGLEYETLSDETLGVGDTEVTVAVTCLTTGEDGNCSIGDIDTIDDISVDIPTLAVTNETEIIDGTDYEEDEEYRIRLLEFVRKDDFGSIGYYESLGNSVDGVHDVVLLDDTNNVYTKIVYVNGDTKPVTASVLAGVTEAYTDTQNIVVGHTFYVQAANTVNANLTVNMNVKVEMSETDLEDYVQKFFDGGDSTPFLTTFDGLYIGESVTNAKLSDIFTTMDNVVSVTIIDDGTTQELTTLSVDTDEVLKLQSISFVQTVVS